MDQNCKNHKKGNTTHHHVDDVKLYSSFTQSLCDQIVWQTRNLGRKMATTNSICCNIQNHVDITDCSPEYKTGAHDIHKTGSTEDQKMYCSCTQLYGSLCFTWYLALNHLCPHSYDYSEFSSVLSFSVECKHASQLATNLDVAYLSCAICVINHNFLEGPHFKQRGLQSYRPPPPPLTLTHTRADWVWPRDWIRHLIRPTTLHQAPDTSLHWTLVWQLVIIEHHGACSQQCQHPLEKPHDDDPSLVLPAPQNAPSQRGFGPPPSNKWFLCSAQVNIANGI